MLNKSSPDTPFREFFASFRGPHFPKSRIRIKNQIYQIKQTRIQTIQLMHQLLSARMNGSNQNVIVICCFFSLGPIPVFFFAAVRIGSRKAVRVLDLACATKLFQSSVEMAFGRFVSRSCRFCSRRPSCTHFWKQCSRDIRHG